MLRQASCYSEPTGVAWAYVQAPALGPLIDWFGLPQSSYPFGVIRIHRELTIEECKRFDLELWIGDTSTGS